MGFSEGSGESATSRIENEKDSKHIKLRNEIRLNVNKTKKQNKRRKRKNKKSFKRSVRFLGVNSAGIRSKLTSFKNVLNELKPIVFYVEETKLKDEGKLKLDNYDVFELVRKSRDGGGGLALGCLKEL